MQAVKIATKYLLFVLVSVMVSVVILSIGLYLHSSHATKKEVDRRLSFAARHIRDLVEGDIERVKGDLMILLANKSLEEYFTYLDTKEMDYAEDSRATLEENSLKIAEAKPQYAILRIFRADGKGIVNITDKKATHKYPDPTKTEWFKSALSLSEGESYASGLYMCSEHKLPALFVSHPYYYRGRFRALGILHLYVQDFIGGMLRDIEVGKTGYAYLVDSKGIVVAHKYPSRVGTDVSGLKSTKAVLEGDEGSLVERAETADILMKKFYLPLGIKGAGIVVAQSLDEAMAISNNVKWYVIGIAVVVAVFLLLLIFFARRKTVLGPSENFELYRRASEDEIQDLDETWNLMALSLTKHISGLKEKEKILRHQGQLLQTILDATPDIVSLQDRESAYQAVNEAFRKFVSKEEKDIIGKTDFDLFPEDLAEKNHQESLKVMEMGKPLEKQDEVKTAKGKKWFHAVKIPVRDPDGNVTGILWSRRDITELKAIQARLVQSQKMESIGHLAAGIAHEINTPLGIILGYAQLLSEEVPEGGDTYGGLQVIERQSKICRKIVSDLLTFSRYTQSTVTSLDIDQTLEEVVSVMEHTFKLDRVKIERNYDPNLPPVKGDKEKLKQVFVNLLNNAYDAIHNDGTISITTSFDDENAEVVISVADTGSGISPENMEKIFDPFFTTKGVGKGVGLGLSVTFGIIQEHGGRIEVQSPPSSAKEKGGAGTQGTAFIIHLPVSEVTGLENKKREMGDGKNISVG